MTLPLPLPAGTTLPRPDAAAAKLWLGVVHRSTRASPAQVATEVKPIQPGSNFYAIDILSAGNRLELRLSPSLQLVGCAAAQHTPGVRQLVLPFYDVPNAELYRQAGFIVATAAELERPTTAADLQLLTATEQDDVAYHQPGRLGDVIFNWFD